MSVIPKYTLVGINYWPEPTGNAPYNSDLAEVLAAEQYVRVIAGVPHYPWWEKQQNFDDSGYLESFRNLEIIRRNHFVPRRQSNLKRAVMELDFGLKVVFSGRLEGENFILVSPAMISSAVILFWLKLFKRKSRTLVWAQDLYEQGLKETGSNAGILGRLIASVENWMLRSADKVVFAHQRFSEVKGMDIQSHRFYSIPNWSQFEFSPKESRELTRSRYGFEDSLVVLHIGNMGVKQGLSHVLEAAKIAASINSNIKFVFVGGGNQVHALTDQSHGLNNVVFIPPVSETDLSNLLNAADVLLVHEAPGVKEMSIPSKLTTYFQSEKPVLVVSERDSLAAKTVIENKIGYWAESGNSELLLEALQTLDLDNSRAISALAKKYALENLGKNEALTEFLRVINE